MLTLKVAPLNDRFSSSRLLIRDFPTFSSTFSNLSKVLIKSFCGQKYHPVGFPSASLPRISDFLIMDENGNVKPYQYEFFVYYRLRDYVAQNILDLNDTLQFKSLAVQKI